MSTSRNKNERPHIQKCSKCGSGRIIIRGSKVICQRPGCNYENDINPNRPAEFYNWKVKDK